MSFLSNELKFYIRSMTSLCQRNTKVTKSISKKRSYTTFDIPYIRSGNHMQYASITIIRRKIIWLWLNVELVFSVWKITYYMVNISHLNSISMLMNTILLLKRNCRYVKWCHQFIINFQFHFSRKSLRFICQRLWHMKLNSS